MRTVDNLPLVAIDHASVYRPLRGLRDAMRRDFALL